MFSSGSIKLCTYQRVSVRFYHAKFKLGRLISGPDFEELASFFGKGEKRKTIINLYCIYNYTLKKKLNKLSQLEKVRQPISLNFLS